MSNWNSRQKRKRLQRQLRDSRKAEQAARFLLQGTSEQLNRALAQLRDAERAVMRARYDYGPAVRWSYVSRPIVLEDMKAPEVPYIELRLLGKREFLDPVVYRRLGPAAIRDYMQRRTAQELADAMVVSGMVAIDEAEIPLRSDCNVYEFDWAVYVGRPVPRTRIHAPEVVRP